MAIKQDNQQICIVLKKSTVKKLDALAEYEFRTRSAQAAKIITEYIENFNFAEILGDDE